MLTINSIAVALWFGICMITSVIFCPDVVYHGPTLLEIKEDWEDLEISELLVCIATCPDHLTTSYIGYGKTRLRVTPIETRLWHLSLNLCLAKILEESQHQPSLQSGYLN